MGATAWLVTCLACLSVVGLGNAARQPKEVHRRPIGAQYPSYQQPPQPPSADAPIAQPGREPAPQAPAPQQYQSAPQQYQNSPYQQPQQDPAPIPTDPRPIDFDCSQRTDGYYAGQQQCTKDYFACAAGHAHEFQCPGSLVFDSAIQACDYPSECGQPRATTTPPKPRFDCSARSDGYYTHGPCPKDYFHCLAGTTFALACPGGTVFDSAIEACDWPEACGKPRTTPPPTKPPQRDVIRPVNFDCSRRTDGIYVAQPCQDHYFHCANGIAHQFTCAPGTLFDPTSEACQYADACGAAPAADPPAPNKPVYGNSHGGAGYHNQPQQDYQQQDYQQQPPQQQHDYQQPQEQQPPQQPPQQQFDQHYQPQGRHH